MLKCERDLGNGKSLVMAAEPFVEGERPTISLTVEDGGKTEVFLSGTSRGVRDLAEWLNDRAGEVDDMHGFLHRGWKEE
nr:MAG TPA_asm: hypothetical protein [Caudoviricetes sp.]